MPDYRKRNHISYICVITLAIFVFMVLLLKHEVDKTNQTFNDVQQQILERIRTTAEEAYFEGQKDYMNGNIRIQKNGDCYVWIKSPWDGTLNQIPRKCQNSTSM